MNTFGDIDFVLCCGRIVNRNMQTSIEHFNAFCELMSKTRILKSQGKLRSEEGDNILLEMVYHYNFFTKKMEDYINKWKLELVDIGFYIKLNEPAPLLKNKVDISDLEFDDSVETTGSEEHILIRKDFAYKDKKEVLVGNYCEFSTPFSNLTKEHQQELRRKLQENKKFEQYARMNPEHAISKIQRKNRNKRMWTIADSERDW